MSYRWRADFESEFFEQMTEHFVRRELEIVTLEPGVASDFETTGSDSSTDASTTALPTTFCGSG